MNKQVIIAGALGAAAAWTCDQPFVTRADELVVKATQAQTDAATAVTNADAALIDAATGALATTADTNAKDLVSAQDTAIAAYDTALTNAKLEAKKQKDAEAAALAAKGASNAAGFNAEMVKYNTPTTGTIAVAAAAVSTQQGKIDTQAAIVANLDADVTALAAERLVLAAAVVTANAARNAQMILAAAATRALAYAIESQSTTWQGANTAGAVVATCQERRVLTDPTKIVSKYNADGTFLEGGWEDQWWNATGEAVCTTLPKSLAVLTSEKTTELGVAAAGGNLATGLVLAKANADAAWTTASDEQAAALEAYDLAMRLKALYLAGCSKVDKTDIPLCSGSSSTAVSAAIYDMRALHTAKDGSLAGLLATLKTKTEAVSLAVEVSAAAEVDVQIATDLIAFYGEETTAITNLTTASGATLAAKTAAVGLETTAKTAALQALQAEKTAIDQETAAGPRAARGLAYLNTLKAQILPLQAAVSVQEYLLAEATKKRDAEQVLETAATGLRAAADAAVIFATETVRDAKLNQTFLTDRAANAAAALKVFTDAVADANGAKSAADGKLQMAKDAAAAALIACQGEGYAKAQAAKQMAVTAEAARAALVTSTKAAYDAQVDRGLLCAFPAVGADGTQAPRAGADADGVACGGNAEMCCGAAQKFLKDGTKLSIETCQTTATTHTYKYWPALPTGAIVEPKPETWRWQCISGAQKLVAAATATLAASYMMA